MSQPFTIASNQGSIGGGEVMLFAIAEAARELGCDVTVVAPADPSEVAALSRSRGFRTIAIPGKGTAAYLRNLRRWDKKNRKGLLWCNGLRPALATAGRPQRIVELHQQPSSVQVPLAHIATQGAVRVVVPSRSMSAALPGARVLWNWVDPISNGSRSRDGETTVIGFLGRLSTDKGALVLCDAMRELQRRRPGQFKLLIGGESRFVDPADASRVQDALSSLGDLVQIRGWMARDEFFDAVDIAVFPSVWAEPFGLVVAEAMSARVPFVISDAGALAEVAGADHPWIAPAGDSLALADTIERATSAPYRHIDQSHQRWQTNFSPAAGRDRLKDLLDELHPVSGKKPEVALAHDYLTQRGGAERVALTLAQAFPSASLTTAVYEPDDTYPEFRDVDVRTSWLNRIAAFRRNFRLGLPLYGLAFSTTTAGKEADVVIVSTTGFAHGVRTNAKKIVYCHSPARFLYLVDDYLGKPWWRTPTGWVLMALRPALVAWDQRAARSADIYLANSTVVRERIKQVYGIEAAVIHPPYALDPTGEQEPIDEMMTNPGPFHLVVSRLMPYKNVEVVIESFRGLPDHRLLIIGRGPLRDQLRANLPPNVTMVEGVSDAQMRWAYANALAVIAASKEDFGLTPVEGFAFGTPTLALEAGGYLDTVVEGVSGWFFESATPLAVRLAVEHLAANPIDATGILSHAQQFSPETFTHAIEQQVARLLRS